MGGLSRGAGGRHPPHHRPPACYLLLGGHLSRHQQPEKPLRQRLLSPRGFGQQLLALGDAVPAEADALKSPARASAAAASPTRGGCPRRAGSGPTSSGSSTEVSYTSPFMPLIPPYTWRRAGGGSHRLRPSLATPARPRHPPTHHVHSDLPDGRVAVLLPEALDFRLLLGDHAGKDILQVLGRGEGAVSPGTHGGGLSTCSPHRYRRGVTAAGASLTVAALAWRAAKRMHGAFCGRADTGTRRYPGRAPPRTPAPPFQGSVAI